MRCARMCALRGAFASLKGRGNYLPRHKKSYRPNTRAQRVDLLSGRFYEMIGGQPSRATYGLNVRAYCQVQMKSWGYIAKNGHNNRGRYVTGEGGVRPIFSTRKQSWTTCKCHGNGNARSEKGGPGGGWEGGGGPSGEESDTGPYRRGSNVRAGYVEPAAARGRKDTLIFEGGGWGLGGFLKSEKMKVIYCGT